MKTFVIILAQGNQSRLPELTVAKQMLPLPACKNTPIMNRTIRQVWTLLAPTMTEGKPSQIAVVTHAELAQWIAVTGVCVSAAPSEVFLHPMVKTLPNPGNSSLKGISEYLRHTSIVTDKYERIVVLLGDVVYSWACLRAILDGTHWHMGFVGTSDLATDGGELWGLSWEKTAEKVMLDTLATALTKHPPFTKYQPGQMRRWLWEIDRVIDGELVTPDNQLRAGMRRTWFRAIDDYTRDIDLPEHVKQLGALSEHAAADDRANGVTW